MVDPLEKQLDAALRKTIGDARVLAFVFVGLGSAGFALGGLGVRGWSGQVLAAACGLILLAPGVLYFVAGQQLRYRKSSGARLGRWAAAVHVGVVPLSFFGAMLFSRNRMAGLILTPAIVSVFFVPALIAFLFSMNKAMHIARRLEEPGHGFQVLPPQAVLPIEEKRIEEK